MNDLHNLYSDMVKNFFEFFQALNFEICFCVVGIWAHTLVFIAVD